MRTCLEGAGQDRRPGQARPGHRPGRQHGALDRRRTCTSRCWSTACRRTRPSSWPGGARSDAGRRPARHAAEPDGRAERPEYKPPTPCRMLMHGLGRACSPRSRTRNARRRLALRAEPPRLSAQATPVTASPRQPKPDAACCPRLLTPIFGSRNDRLLKQYRRVAQQVNALEPQFEALDDAALRAKTDEFRAAAGRRRDRSTSCCPRPLRWCARAASAR